MMTTGSSCSLLISAEIDSRVPFRYGLKVPHH
jgi:hypothetical protein